MAVDDQDLFEAVVGDGFGDIEAEGYKGLRLDMNGAGEVDVVHINAGGDGRQDQHLVGGAAAYFQADGLG